MTALVFARLESAADRLGMLLDEEWLWCTIAYPMPTVAMASVKKKQHHARIGTRSMVG